MNYKNLAKVCDSANAIYKVFYPVEGKKDLEVESFSGTEEEAKAAAEDFAANFPREKVIIQKVGDSSLSQTQRAELSKMIKDAFVEGDIYNDGTTSGKIARVENDYIVVETQNEEGDVQNVEVPIEDFLNPVKDAESDVVMVHNSDEATDALGNGKAIDVSDWDDEQSVDDFMISFEDFQLDDAPEPMHLERNGDIIELVFDSESDADDLSPAQAARDIVTESTVNEIEDNGFAIIDVPSEVESIDDFASECAAVAQDIADKTLGSPDKGYADIQHTVEDGQVVLYIAQ